MSKLIRRLKKDEIRGRSNFSLGGALIVIIVGLVLWMPINLWMKSSESSSQKELVDSILKKDCDENCSKYGVVLGDLVGPNFEYYRRTGRDAGEYKYSWHSRKNDLVVQVKVSWTPESRVNSSIAWIQN